MPTIVRSNNNVPIRLTDERWAHITEEHSELAGMRYDILETLASPEKVYKAITGERFAVRENEASKVLIVVYREFESDGFVITAFLTRRMNAFASRELVWSAPK